MFNTSTDKPEVTKPLKSSCSMINDTCNLNKPLSFNLSCVKSDPTQLSGRYYNVDKPETHHSNIILLIY